MATMGKPRKPSTVKCEDLSVSELVEIPLKRRLEILFASNIIPCRRQLSLKYNLSEKLIHNVLSHRRYLLENWKYNADDKSLLSKLELENAMAMTELLIEWKRRVQLNGLQITYAALARKAAYLQRVLNGSNDTPSDDWWNQFDINWELKCFQDYENDSLDMEDILNDLQWMFSESAYRRLMLRLQQAKYGQRVRHGNMPNTRNKIEGSNEVEEHLGISEIKAEPHYYNDDDFDCEDYEFVLDEEAVIDALRKELEDSEQLKYQQYLLGGTSSEAINPEEAKNDDKKNVECEQKNDEEEEKMKQERIDEVTENVIDEQNRNIEEPRDESIDNEIEPKIDLTAQKVSPVLLPVSSEPLPVIKVEDSPKPSRTGSTTNDSRITNTSVNSVTVAVQPKQPKRKPRNSNPIVSLRKDYVRMPAATEIVMLARKQCLDQLLEESDYSDDDSECDENQKISIKRRGKVKPKSTKGRISKSIMKKSVSISNTEPSSLETLSSDIQQNNDVDVQFNLETSASTSKQSFSNNSFFDVKQEMPSPMASDIEEFIDEGSEAIENVNATDTNFNTNQSNHAEQNNNGSNMPKDSLNDVICKDISRSRRRINITATNDTGSILKLEMGIKGDISCAAIQRKNSKDDSYQPHTTKRRISRPRKTPKRKQKKLMPPAKSPPKQSNVHTTAFKRAKRRTDDSDLTLRKDKVRIGSVRLTSGNELIGQTTETETALQPFVEKN